MAERFEIWAREEISRLRDEADHLERTLARFQSASHPDQRVAAQRPPYVLHRRSSKNEVVLDAIDRAGPDGLSLDDIERVAREAGIQSSRNTLRSLCWNEKQRGRLKQVGVGRFAAVNVLRDEAAGQPLPEKPAASISETPNNADRRGEVEHIDMNH